MAGRNSVSQSLRQLFTGLKVFSSILISLRLFKKVDYHCVVLAYFENKYYVNCFNIPQANFCDSLFVSFVLQLIQDIGHNKTKYNFSQKLGPILHHNRNYLFHFEFGHPI